MDNIILRFPAVAQKIFKKLNNDSLMNCLEINKIWNDFFHKDSIIWKRLIQTYIKDQTIFQKEWNLVTKKIKIETLKKFALAMEEFYNTSDIANIDIYENQLSPHHIVAESGNICLFEFICERIGSINPATTKDNFTALHFAAKEGRFETVKYIAENLEIKNPSDIDGTTQYV